MIYFYQVYEAQMLVNCIIPWIVSACLLGVAPGLPLVRTPAAGAGPPTATPPPRHLARTGDRALSALVSPTVRPLLSVTIPGGDIELLKTALHPRLMAALHLWSSASCKRLNNSSNENNETFEYYINTFYLATDILISMMAISTIITSVSEDKKVSWWTWSGDWWPSGVGGDITTDPRLSRLGQAHTYDITTYAGAAMWCNNQQMSR